MNSYYYNLAFYLSEVVSKSEDRVALHYPDKTISYCQLNNWVERLAALLLNKRGKKGDVIVIGHNKRPLSYALMLAALRLGIAYVNIDVTSPLARNLHILQISDPVLLFFDDPTYQDAMEKLSIAHGCPFLLLDEEKLPQITDADRQEQKNFSRRVDGACIAYIMFTSGSTGIPKGVAVTHQNVLHFIAWGQDRFKIAAQDNLANLSPMYFDNSVFDFYIGLFSGASLTPISRELLSSPYDLVTYVGKMSCTIWFSVPSLLIYLMTMKALNTDSLPSLRTIVFGGEGYPKVELKKLYDVFSQQATLVNVYGPTECTCICSAYTLREGDFLELEGLPPLGVLNPNFDYRIIDDEGSDVTTGELCLIGPNVAAGYFNDPKRTAEAFHTLTDLNRYMKRMYRTGDLVQEIDDKLHFIGRKDNQIKHMGYRIELEEIEHALIKFPQVTQAAVIYQRSTTAYGKLIGFVASGDNLEESAILDGLNELLPRYMVPSKLFVLPELPKNPNGKVDRQQLRILLDN